VGQQLGPFAHEIHPTSQEIARGLRLSGINVGLREHATTQQDGNFLRIDLVVFGFTPMDRFYRESVSQHEGNALAAAEVG
jgi:hypothetical protein